jgi:hypothetical protein
MLNSSVAKLLFPGCCISAFEKSVKKIWNISLYLFLIVQNQYVINHQVFVEHCTNFHNGIVR